MVARELLHELAEALLPQRCIACGRFGAALHEACLAALPAAEPPRCARCWAPGPRLPCAARRAAPPPFEGFRASYRFGGVARRALLEAKFRGVGALLDPLGDAAAEAVPRDWLIDAVVPIPLHPSRRRRRGFNQAERLARRVAERLGLPLRADLLRRVRATAPQATLDAEQRATNIDDAFAAAADPPPALLLVDDVSTTGATLAAAAKALREAGAERGSKAEPAVGYEERTQTPTRSAR